MSLLSVELFPAQLATVASYFRSNPEVARGYGLAPAELGAPVPERPETFTYHLGPEPTPGRGYDDRLTMRLGIGRTRLMEELTRWKEHGGKRGGLRFSLNSDKYVVSELACREWLGDPIA